MALVFPSNPSVGQTHTDGTRSWRWTGARWQSVQASPLAHKSTHAIGGSDPLTAADIGAAALQSSDPDSSANCITNIYGSGDQICTFFQIVNSKNSYVWSGAGNDVYYIFWDGSRWVARYSYTGDGSFDVNYYSTGNVNYPWLANWTGSGALVIRSGINTTSDLGSSSAGIATTASRSDHVHKLPTTTQIGAEPAFSTLPITKGGTGATDAATARTNLGVAGASSQIDIFANTGSTNWTKPVGAKVVNIQLLAGGGGGGAGNKNANLTNRSGGGGGGGGGYLNVSIPASVLPSTPINITIGAGGAGGTPSATNGNTPLEQSSMNGNSGGSTIFGTGVSGTITYVATGGAGGVGGSSSSGGAGTGSLNANNGSQGNVGSGGAGFPTVIGNSHFMGGAGGGGGGGISNAATPVIGNASNGGRSNLLNLPGGPLGTAGSNNTNAANGLVAVGSGGGGAAASRTVQNNGGNGGFPSSGGGGGGASEATSSGAGGTGGAGMAVIITYF